MHSADLYADKLSQTYLRDYILSFASLLQSDFFRLFGNVTFLFSP